MQPAIPAQADPGPHVAYLPPNPDDAAPVVLVPLLAASVVSSPPHAA